jgi:phosphoserine aminotransferase
MVPFNLMKENGKAAYLDTGTWSAGNKEAKPLEKPLLL